jgi:hypothetical protein
LIADKVVENQRMASVITETWVSITWYTLLWDLTQTITLAARDNIIIFMYRANTWTQYKVEYYLENIEDDEYYLYETGIQYGTSDTIW